VELFHVGAVIGASNTPDWTTILATVAAGLLTAIAALGGVLITQQSERRKAHADRVWVQRSSVYEQLFAWVREFETQVYDTIASISDDAEGQDISSIFASFVDRIDSNGDLVARTDLYGSDAVNTAYVNLVRQVGKSYLYVQQLPEPSWLEDLFESGSFIAKRLKRSIRDRALGILEPTDQQVIRAGIAFGHIATSAHELLMAIRTEMRGQR
jgi:hypothetical protein